MRVVVLSSIDQHVCCFDVYVDDTDAYFGEIISFGFGKPLVMTERNQVILKAVPLQLRNQQLLC